jgi:hypothetical protein
MAIYLVVAHQTARCGELIDGLLEKKSLDPEARFVLLVPATPVEHLPNAVEPDNRANAERVAREAETGMKAEGVDIMRTAIGDASPLVEIGEELAANPNLYAGIVLCTLPVEQSRWLQMNLPKEAENRFQLPVTHLFGASVPGRAPVSD